LPSKVTRIALIGPLADNQQDLLGCWSCAGRAADVETVLEGFRAVLPDSVTLHYVKGCEVEGDAALDLDGAVTAALDADVAVLVVGESAMMSGEAHSRAYLGLPGRQQALIEAVVATGKPVVAVVMSGRPLVLSWMAEHVPATLQAWHGGVRAGRAVAEIVMGHVNPSGRLVVSFPRTEGQIPVHYAHKSTGRPVNERGVIQFNRAHRTQYLDELTTPLYGFGFGLSYTTFEYRELRVETPQVTQGDTLVVSATVGNIGTRAGDEVVQLYVQDVVGEITRPVRELKEFKRISLEAGESRRVVFEMPVQELGFHGLDMRYIVEPGEFRVWIGPNAYEGLIGSFTVLP